MTGRYGFGLGAAALVLGVGAATAGGPVPGCYARDYSDAHLAANPDQVVDRIVLRVRADAGAGTVADLWVITARQGHVLKSGQGGRRFTQFLYCRDESRGPVCAVECDGGSFTVTAQGPDGLSFSTDYLLVGEGEGCGGAVDLAERPGRAVTYRLDRVAWSVCDGEG